MEGKKLAQPHKSPQRRERDKGRILRLIMIGMYRGWRTESGERVLLFLPTQFLYCHRTQY